MTKKKLPAKQEPWLGWYFAPADEKLRYGDGRHIKVGLTHKVDCKPVLCEIGLHASKSILDACGYASSNILFRVELSGKIVDGNDKSSATARKYIVRIDVESILFEFARKCALAVIHLWNCPPVVKEYLETGNKNSCF